MRILGIVLIAGLSSLAVSVGAHAATTLSTPVVAGDTAACIMTNGSAPEFQGGAVTPQGDTCATGPLAPGASCVALYGANGGVVIGLAATAK